VWLVVHDPEPLRRQRGHGRLASTSEALARISGVRVVAHSRPAADVLRAQGWDPVCLPHPVAPPTPLAVRGPDGPVVVLGQYKPARSLETLLALSAIQQLNERRRIHGRGWPPVPGWEREDRFLTEQEFDAVLGGARCVVLPYDRYYQSNVAVRALETSVPVLARRHPFLEELLGADWPGFVEGDGWAEALERLNDLAPEQLKDRCLAANEQARHAWRSAMGELGH
jgi:glycosyltransferase involved in cell wall biosynthesis